MFCVFVCVYSYIDDTWTVVTRNIVVCILKLNITVKIRQFNVKLSSENVITHMYVNIVAVVVK